MPPHPYDLPPIIAFPDDRSSGQPGDGYSDTPVETAGAHEARAAIASVARTPVHAVALELAVRMRGRYLAGALPPDEARGLAWICRHYGIDLGYYPTPRNLGGPVLVARAAAWDARNGGSA